MVDSIDYWYVLLLPGTHGIPQRELISIHKLVLSDAFGSRHTSIQAISFAYIFASVTVYSRAQVSSLPIGESRTCSFSIQKIFLTFTNQSIDHYRLPRSTIGTNCMRVPEFVRLKCLRELFVPRKVARKLAFVRSPGAGESVMREEIAKHHGFGINDNSTRQW